MPQGTIKRLLSERGFGFISGERGELFFHHSALEGTTIESLRVGQAVEYEEDVGGKGARAKHVALVGASSGRAERLCEDAPESAPAFSSDWSSGCESPSADREVLNRRTTFIEFTCDVAISVFDKKRFLDVLAGCTGVDLSKTEITSVRQGSAIVRLEGDERSLGEIVTWFKQAQGSLHALVRETGLTHIEWNLGDRTYVIDVKTCDVTPEHGRRSPRTDEQGAAYRYDAFLSYRHRGPDKSFAVKLLNELEASGYRVAIDMRDFSPNEAFLEEMERCIRESKFTLAVVSASYLDSSNCGEEAIICKVLGMTERKRRLIPLIRERVEMPTWMYGIVGVDFVDSEPFVAPIERLKSALGEPCQCLPMHEG